MKYSVKALLWKHDPNEQGYLPIYIKVSIASQVRYISTGHFIHEKYWDLNNTQVRSTHKDAALINADVEHRRRNIVKIITEAHLKDEIITAEAVKRQASSTRDLHNIFDFAAEFSEQVKNKREGATIENYRKHLLRLELFHGSRNLSFEEITPDYLTRYENHLWETVNGNYIYQLIKAIRTLFNAARKKKIITCYPFDEFEMPVYEAPGKDHLTIPELERWEKNYHLMKDPVLKQTALYFMFGCYTGLRISDWIAFDVAKNVEGGRLKLRADKNGEWVSMMISKPLARIIKDMKKLPLTIQEPTINEKLKKIAALEEVNIKKHLTTHTGRHTFAITLCANRGISCETAAELMGITVKTCLENYYKVTGYKINAETARAWEGLN
ncbi:phage integrase SAM-like domain-containing protein [Flavitalea antarctica]